MPKPPMKVYSVPAFGGGINDNAAYYGGMQEDESVQLVNMILDGRGKMALRRGTLVKQILTDQAGNAVEAVLGIWAWGTSGTMALTWQDGDSDGLAEKGTLAISATATKFKTTTTAKYYISDTLYTKTATDNLVFSAADTINSGAAAGQFWGVWAIQINAAGTVSTKSPASNQTYATEALAIAALPSPDASNVLLGYVTIESVATSTWTANTSNISASDYNFYDYYQDVYCVQIHTSSSQDGTGFSYVTDLWTNVTTLPKVSVVEINAGAGGLNTPDSTWPAGNRMYFAESTGGQTLKFFAESDSTVYEVQREFREGQADEALYPRYVAEYNYHLFAGGYQDGGYTGAEVVRYSTPGLIAIDDDSTTEGAGETELREWHQDGYEAVGRPGEKIMWMAKAGGGLVIGKENNIHRWWGYDADTWGQIHIDGLYGAVNEQVIVAGRYAYYLSPYGPCRTEGVQVEFIGEPIQQFFKNLGDTTECRIVHDPLRFQVIYFFIDSAVDSTYPTIGKAFNYLVGAWTELEYFKTQSTTGQLAVHAGGTVGTVTVPGPTAGPSSLAGTDTLGEAACTHTIALTWTNGDNYPNTTTELYRIKSETAPSGTDWTDGTATLIKVLESGVASYNDTFSGSASTFGKKYWYQVRHLRNGQYSNWNNNNADPLATDVSVTADSPTAAPSAPTGLTASDASYCKASTPYYREQLSWTNNHGGHTNEAFCVAEIYGSTDNSNWTLADTVSTWSGSTTFATQSAYVNHPDRPNLEYLYWRIRVKDNKQGCGDAYKYSSYTSSVGTDVTANPCDDSEIIEL